MCLKVLFVSINFFLIPVCEIRMHDCKCLSVKRVVFLDLMFFISLNSCSPRMTRESNIILRHCVFLISGNYFSSNSVARIYAGRTNMLADHGLRILELDYPLIPDQSVIRYFVLSWSCFLFGFLKV